MASLVDQGRGIPAAPTTATIVEERRRRSGSELYVGGLDGLRAIAVVAVVVYHFAPSVLPAGFLGVDVFFVVSGFLIGRLVTREIGRSGTVSLRAFWVRRARRLLPALATVTVVVLSIAAVKSSSAEMHNLRTQAIGALFYCGNWVLIFTKSNYFTSLGRPSPFLHLWTLALEEQFYIVLPLALFAARRVVVRRPVVVATVAFAGAVASTVWMSVLVVPTTDPSRALPRERLPRDGSPRRCRTRGARRVRPRVLQLDATESPNGERGIASRDRVAGGDPRRHARGRRPDPCSVPGRVSRGRRPVRGDHRGRGDAADRADCEMSALTRARSRSDCGPIRCICGTGRCASSSRPRRGSTG